MIIILLLQLVLQTFKNHGVPKLCAQKLQRYFQVNTVPESALRLSRWQGISSHQYFISSLQIRDRFWFKNLSRLEHNALAVGSRIPTVRNSVGFLNLRFDRCVFSKLGIPLPTEAASCHERTKFSATTLRSIKTRMTLVSYRGIVTTLKLSVF
jgi:hypothetical protein